MVIDNIKKQKMKLLSLFSGGKDSVYAVFYALQQGFEISSALIIRSRNPDSFMFHTPNIDLAQLQIKAMKMKAHVIEVEGVEEKEVLELKKIIKKIKKEEGIEGILTGALASDYQRTRIEKICHDLGLASINPLWHIDGEVYINELIDSGFKAMIVACAAEGFDKHWLGETIDRNALEELKKLNKKYKVHVAGEGGEYETFVVDCPAFIEELRLSGEPLWSNGSGIYKLEVQTD